MVAARAIRFAQELGISPYIIEGDAEVVINTLKSDEESSLLLVTLFPCQIIFSYQRLYFFLLCT